MSDEAHATDHDSPHEGPIKTPKQLVLAVFYSFVVPIFGIVLLVTFVASSFKPGAGSDGQSAEAVAQRIQPVGRVEVKDPNDLSSMKAGDQVFAAQCASCHATGAVGAPKIGDAAAWAPRLAQGFNTLLQSALKGKGNMPPQGGGDFSDFEIARAVVHLANQSGGKLAEPAFTPPAAQAAAAGGAAAAAAPTGGADAAAAQAQVAAALAAAAPKPGAAPAAGAVPALYTQTCQACHAAGVAGAPKTGDKAAWAPRIAQGMDALHAAAIKGKGAMPPKGGAMAAPDADVIAAVDYMVSASK